MSINTPRSFGLEARCRASSLLGPRQSTQQLLGRSHQTRKPALRARIICQLTDKGRSVQPGDIQVKSPLGEGSYGQVFEGWLETPKGRERVVLKRVKNRVEGAAEMGQMEHLLNVYASRSARDSVAPFVGYSQVTQEHATRSLTEGTWLLWKFEGGKTLAHYLRRRDCLQRLSEDLDLPEEAVVPTVMQHIFEGLSGLHGAGLVHRDIKPLNIIFAEEQRRFKLIDLGACADLRTGTNYAPDESILDPTYCPPEQYCMPTDSPHLAKQLKPLAIAMSPMLWTRFKPDRFDSYSCGLVLLQLAVPKLRSASGIKNFNQQYKKARFDLEIWRASERLTARESAILDANNGAGWDLAAALLRPRDIQVDEMGGVVFVNKGGAIRLPIKAALQHKFLRQARQVKPVQSGRAGGSTKRRGPSGTTTAPTPASQSSSLVGSALGFWRAASSKLAELEFKLYNQEQAVVMQTDKVEVLKEGYRTGRVKKEVLERQEGLLGKMTSRLNQLQGEFGATTANAQRVISFLGPKEKLSKQARAVALQQGKVEYLREEYATGKIRIGDLQRQEGLLQKMTNRLGSLQDELNSSVAGVQRMFGFLGGKKQAADEAVSEPQIESRGLFNAFRRSDRSDRGLTEPLSRGSSGQRKGRRSGGSGNSGSSSAKRSAPDGNISTDSGFSLFGRPKEAQPQAPAAQRTRSDLPPSFLNRMAKSSNGGAEQKATGTDQRSLGQSAAGAAVTGIYAGLKLTGFALRVATDMATSLSKDANSAFAGNEELQAAKRRQRAARNSFLELLRECAPPVAAQSRWTQVRRRVVNDPRFQELEEPERVAMFSDYTAELASLEEARLRRGEEQFLELLSEAGLQRDSSLKALKARLQTDVRFSKLPSSLDLDRLFNKAMEARAPEFDFWDLLRECRSPPLTKDVNWGEARRQVVDDPRFNALTERQRRAIFRTFVSSIKEPESAPATLLPVTPVKTIVGGGAQKTEDVVEASRESLSSLQALRAEQARLKSEYERMEAKLREMELLLRKGDRDSSEKARLHLNHLTHDMNGKLPAELLRNIRRCVSELLQLHSGVGTNPRQIS